MTKAEFLGRLAARLEQKNVSDISDIVEEYEQHFAFKLADGFSEEEIAAKLGDPEALAAQFGGEAQAGGSKGSRALAVAGLCLSGVAAGALFVLLAAWGAILAAFSLCAAAAAICLMATISPWSLLPPMPHGVAVIVGVALLALAVLSAAGCVWFMAFLRQLCRAYGRFQRNAMAVAAGRAPLPPLAAYPSFKPQVKRGLRRVALISLSVFAAFFVLGMATAMISAGSLEFWHAWGWFGYAA